MLQSSAEEVLGEEAPELKEGSTLAEIDLDSLDLIEMMMVLEEQHGLELLSGSFQQVETVSEVMDLVQSLLLGRP